MEKIKDFPKNTFASLAIRNFRLYFIGQMISLSGTWMQTVAQAWLVLNLTHSGFQLGLVTALQYLPVLLFGPWGGLIADRLPKRSLLYFTQGMSGILAVILGLLVLTNTVTLWEVYVLAVALGLLTTIDNPTRQTFVFEMVGQDQLANAVSLNSMLFNIARVIGPAIGGALIAGVGLAWCFLLNGISYVAVLIVLYMMRETEFHIMPRAERAKGQIAEGFRYVRHNPLLRNTLLMMAIIGTLTYEFQVILPLFATETFHGGANAYALLTVAMGGGAIIGGLFTASRKNFGPNILVATAFLFGLVILITAVMPTLTLAFLALILVGICSIAFTSIGNVSLQLEAAPEMRGRVMALWTIAFLGSTPIGGPIVGYLGEHFGARLGLAVGGFAAIAAAVLGVMTIVRAKIPINGEVNENGG